MKLGCKSPTRKDFRCCHLGHKSSEAQRRLSNKKNNEVKINVSCLELNAINLIIPKRVGKPKMVGSLEC